MIINNNMNAMNAHRNMSFNTTQTGKAMEKLSSGLRINRAGDDAAGLAISEKMRGQIRGLDQASRNAQDGISLIQTAEGALNETHSILQRMREIAVQAGNDTNTTSDRGEIQKELDQLVQEIDRIGNDTEFNTKKLLNGGAGLDVKFNAETVNSVNKDWLTVTGGSATTKTGTIDITAASKAAGATLTLTAGAADAATTKSISINGTTVNFTGSTTASTNTDNLKAALDAVAKDLGITVTQATAGGNIVITDNTVGSSSKLAVTSATNVLGTTALNASDVGEDAILTGVTATDYKATGNSITFINGNYEGLELKLNASAMSSTASDNDANFTINSNGTLSTMIGANEGQSMSITISDMRSSALGVSTLDVSTSTAAESAVTTINTAIENVSAERSKLGAYQNRLEHTINNLSVGAENLQASESRIRDVDMAKEMMNFTKNNILNQAAQAMMAQSKSQPEAVLQLLR